MVKYATMEERIYATIMDVVFISGLSFIIGILISLFNIVIPFLNYSFFRSLWCLIPGLLVVWLYFAGMESSKLQATIGKLIVGVKVTDMKFKRITFSHATKRFFFKIFSVALLFNKKHQWLHDRLTDTLVIKE